MKAQLSPEKARVKFGERLLKACKDDEVKRCAEAVSKGADVNWQNEKGQSAAHVAAAFGALNVLVFLHEHGADFELINDKQLTPQDVAEKIGEDDAATLIEALAADRGSSASEAHGSATHNGSSRNDGQR